MSNTVKLISLNAEQIGLAGETHHVHSDITHAVVCDGFGQLFGSEKHCMSYYKVWSEVFPYIFSGGIELNEYVFEHFKTTPGLLDAIYEAHDPIEQDAKMKEFIGNKQSSIDDGAIAKRSFLSKFLKR